MKADWLITPWFFDTRDAALAQAVPPDVRAQMNDAGPVADRTPASLGLIHRPIARFTERCARRGALAVSVAGDCAASLPVMAGLQAAGLNPVLVWLDAHGDFNTPETSPTGFLGGMPLAMMVGRGDLALARTAGLSPVAESDVWLIGARDFDPLEARALAGSAVNRAGIGALAGLSFDRPVHLHIDNDVIDAGEVPANNYAVPGGPALAGVIAACVAFAARNPVRAVSLSGWNGALDGDGTTAAACRGLMTAVVAACEGRTDGTAMPPCNAPPSA